MEEETNVEICQNCKREVPSANYIMHVAHCQRNIAICPLCGDAVPRGHLNDHHQEQHSLLKCPDCQHKVQSSAMNQHRANECSKRLQQCTYCELELQHVDMDEHETYCGTRTERCDDCGEFVMYKYKQIHLESNHTFLKLNDEPGPTPSWQGAQSNVKSLLPRQSPIKRTNDMPQVNSTIAAKGTNKVPTKLPISHFGDTNIIDRPRNFTQINSNSSAFQKEKTSYKEPVPTGNMKKTNSLNAAVRHSGRLFASPPNSTMSDSVTRQFMKTNLNHVLPVKPNVHHALQGTVKKSTNEETNRTQQSLGAVHRPAPSRKRRPAPPPPVVPPDLELTDDDLMRRMRNLQFTSTNYATSEEIAVKENWLLKNSFPNYYKSPQEDGLTEQPFSVTDELPCEFCKRMIHASKLIQHEAGCRPDLTQFNVNKMNPGRSAGRNSPLDWDLPPLPTEAAATVIAPLSTRNVPYESELPCEFCCELYPASKLLNHQALCDASV